MRKILSRLNDFGEAYRLIKLAQSIFPETSELHNYCIQYLARNFSYTKDYERSKEFLRDARTHLERKVGRNNQFYLPLDLMWCDLGSAT